jgi:hypothetical protein
MKNQFQSAFAGQMPMKGLTKTKVMLPLVLALLSYNQLVAGTPGNKSMPKGLKSKTSASQKGSALTELDPGSISPTNQTVHPNGFPGTLSGSSASGGSGFYSYQWQSSGDGTSWSSISGATSTNYGPSPLTQTTYFRRMVVSNGSAAYSNIATVTVL